MELEEEDKGVSLDRGAVALLLEEGNVWHCGPGEES